MRDGGGGKVDGVSIPRYSNISKGASRHQPQLVHEQGSWRSLRRCGWTDALPASRIAVSMRFVWEGPFGAVRLLDRPSWLTVELSTTAMAFVAL